MEMETAKAWVMQRRIALIGLLTAGLGYGASATVNLTEISNIIHEIVNLVPDLIDLVTGIVPIIVVIALVGFIVAFFDKILGMLKIG